MSVSEDKRYSMLHNWLAAQFADQPFTLTSASSDASFRRYFRVSSSDKTWIVMDAPPEHEDVEPFIRIATLLDDNQLPVPKIYQQDLANGFLLLSDLGSTPYLSVLNAQTAETLYQKAIDCIIQMQLIHKPNDLPDYDKALLQRELSLFDEWFLDRHLSLEKPTFIDDLYPFLIEEALGQPQAFVHRDYHSRNLMLQADETPGIIDFQDAVWGGVTYDLVSLLRDVYIQWPANFVKGLLVYYYEQAIEHGILDKSTSFEALERWFDLIGLQRHLKILGIFCRLNYRDNKPNYINDLPLTLNYVFEVCERYPELSELLSYLQQPAIKDKIL